MKRFIFCVALLLGLCVKSPAPTPNFESPPFDAAQFIVNQPGNFLGIRFPGVTNVVYIPGTFGYISNQIVYIGTNNFAGGGGGSGITELTGDGTAGPGSGSQAFTLATVLGSPGTYRSVTANGKGLITAGSNPTTFAGYGISDTWANLASDLTGLVPTASLATGPANSATFLSGDQTWKTIPSMGGTLTNGFYTNAGPSDTYVITGNLFLKTNNFAGGGGSGGITALTKDVLASGSGSQAATVVGLNGTLLSSLQSGVMLNTFGTGVPGTVSDWPSLASQLTLLIPQSALGTGSSGGGTKFLADDQTYKTVSGGGSGFSNQIAGAIGHVFFSQVTNINTSTDVNGAAVGDMNGDGIPDIVVDKESSTTVYTNTGNGTSFPQASAFTQTAPSGGLALADVNGDGRLDAVASSTGGNYWNVLTNDGIGNLAKLGSNYPLSVSAPNFIQIYTGRLDNNTSQDVIVDAVTTNIVIYTNGGTGNFVFQSTLPSLYAGSRDLAIADMNGDGTNDIAIIPRLAITGSSQGFIVLTNNGNGVFSPWTTNLLITTGGLYSICTGDFNQDGKMDIAVAGLPSSSWVEVFTNNGNGFGLWSSNFFQFTSGGAMVRTANINGVTRPDLVANANNGATAIAVVFTNSGTAMVNALTNTQANALQFLGIGDFNSDGFSDFEEYISSGIVGVFINTPIVSGYFNGNAAGLTNGQITVSFSSSIVTPAASWTAGNPGVNFGSLSINTNYLPFSVNGAKFINGTVMTANTTATVAFNTAGNSEHVYNTSASTIASLAITLSTSAVAGQVNRYSTHGVCTAVAVTGTVSVGAAVTALTADSSVAWQAITSTTWVRIQ